MESVNENKALQVATEFIASHEGFSSTIYKDIAGVPTIGYGFTSKTMINQYQGKVMSEEKAKVLLSQEVSLYMVALENLVAPAMWKVLTVNQVAALTSFIYNVGINAFKNSSVRKHINEGNFTLVPDSLMKWNKYTDPKTKQKVVSKGLDNRRKAEVKLFNTLAR